MSEIECLATEIEDSKLKTEHLKTSLFYNQVVDRFQYISEEELNKSYSLILVKIELCAVFLHSQSYYVDTNTTLIK